MPGREACFSAPSPLCPLAPSEFARPHGKGIDFQGARPLPCVQTHACVSRSKRQRPGSAGPSSLPRGSPLSPPLLSKHILAQHQV